MSSKFDSLHSDDGWEDNTGPGGHLSPGTHRTSQSSASHSVYDEIDQGLPTEKPYHEYGFYFTRRHTHMVVCENDEQKTPVYFAEVSSFTRHKPDITLHSLKGHSGPASWERKSFTTKEGRAATVVATAHFERPSRHVQMGLGDPSQSHGADMVWEEMRNCKRFLHSEYRFELSPNSNKISGFSNQIDQHNVRQGYTWRRTHAKSDGVEGATMIRNLKTDNYNFIEEGKDKGADRVLGVFLQNGVKSWRKKGKLRVYEDKGEGLEGLEAVMILSIASIMEKTRRRKIRSRGLASA